MNDDLAGKARARRFDRVSVVLAILTVLFVGWTAWLRFRPTPRPATLAVGAALPPLKLIELETAQPLLLLGTKGNVTWIIFWSASSATGKECMENLEPVWKRLKAHRRFSMMTAAVFTDPPEQVKAALQGVHATIPGYRAGAEVLRRFGIDSAEPPLQVLVDGDGRIAALVRGGSAETIHRLATQAEHWLDEMDPLGPTRFAASGSPGTP